MAERSENTVEFNGYTFRAINDPSRARYAGKLLSYYDPPSEKWTPQDSQMSTARFRGALLRLFGKPYHSSTLAEEAFDYILEVSDAHNNRWILTAYEGASGSAIGGDALFEFDKESLLPLAELLLQLIDITTPADFDAVVYDDDTDYTVEYGYKDGEYYYREFRGNRLT